ncbi:hypothetical protein M758_5G112700 [Ceratodon purpureus]|nr:hypothetical protein M758_5G112700 [Ceratodon purpureus]
MDRGVKEIICVTVNDPFVVKEWEKTFPNNKHIKFLCDGSATWTKKIGLELDLIDRGMGIRSRRYCLLVDDTVVKIANIEEAGGLEVSTADRIMQDLETSKGS